MKRYTIYYYTGTGNSLQTALDIADKLENAEIVSISKNIGKKIYCYSEGIGFVFPVNGRNVPMIVYQFIENLQVPSNSYFFAIATCGFLPGRTLVTINKLLTKKNAKLNYGKNHRMIANCITAYDIFQDIEKTLEKSDQCLQKYIKDIQNLKPCYIRKGLLPKDDSKYIKEKSYKYSRRGEDFTVSNSCILCKNCVLICPVNNIELYSNKVVFSNKCIQCLACIHWCPTKAINWNNKTQLRKRYHHPKVKIAQLL